MSIDCHGLRPRSDRQGSTSIDCRGLRPRSDITKEPPRPSASQRHDGLLSWGKAGLIAIKDSKGEWRMFTDAEATQIHIEANLVSPHLQELYRRSS